MNLEVLFTAESQLRELATEMQTTNNYREVERDYELITSYVSNVIDNAVDAIRRDYPADLANALIDVLENARKLIQEAGAGITEENVNSQLPIPKSLIEMNESYKSVFGTDCAYTPSLGRRTVSAAMLINDAAACIHRVAEVVNKGKPLDDTDCVVIKPGEAGEAFCRAWYDFTVENTDLYDAGDLIELKGWVVGNKVYLRVGSSPGHRTYVDFDNGEVVYYDRDRPVNKLMKTMLEKAGLKCKYLPGNQGVECTGMTKDKIKPVAAALSLATSMDFRLSGPYEFYASYEVNRAIGEVIRERYANVINEALK